MQPDLLTGVVVSALLLVLFLQLRAQRNTEKSSVVPEVQPDTSPLHARVLELEGEVESLKRRHEALAGDTDRHFKKLSARIQRDVQTLGGLVEPEEVEPSDGDVLEGISSVVSNHTPPEDEAQLNMPFIPGSRGGIR